MHPATRHLSGWTLPLFAALLFGGCGLARAATFTVGNEAACTHTSVQAAINAASGAGPHLIRIKAMNFSAQAINVSGKDISLIGGHASCTVTTASGFTTLSGSGGSASSVFGVTGSGNDVILQNLSIVNGDEVAGGTGGGIDFRGNGFLTLRNTLVTDNSAGDGGGIYFNGSGELRIEEGSLILRNTAVKSGGGIYLRGGARLLMVEDRTAIQNNQAGDFGGGLAMIAPALADIGSPGIGSTGAVFANLARDGGGISLNGVEADGTQATLRLFTTVASRPVRVHGNRASEDGGGIYQAGYADANDRSGTQVCARDFQIDGNRAVQGSALFSQSDETLLNFPGFSTAYLGARDDHACYDSSLPTISPVACAADVDCYLVSDNVNENSSQQATEGATIFLRERGGLAVERMIATGNLGAQFLRAVDDHTGASFSNCLIANNTVTAHLMAVEGAETAGLGINYCTIARNSIGASHVLFTANGIGLRNTIIDQPGRTTLLATGGTRGVGNVLGSEIFSLADGSNLTLTRAAPRFIDPDNGDFHLRSGSQAVDYSDQPIGDIDDPLPDASGRARGINMSLVPDLFGPYDLGAFERQGISNNVLNPGFLQDLRLWDEVRSGVSSWEPAGQNSSGSLRISYTRSEASMPPAGDLAGLSQCVHIPGPGTYRLSGFAYGIGSGFERDQVSLQWELRSNPQGIETCTGTVTRSGSVTFPAGSTWVASPTPALITISPNEWMSYTSLAITPIVREGSLQLLTTTTGHFDGIVLEALVVLGNPIFADGFE